MRVRRNAPEGFDQVEEQLHVYAEQMKAHLVEEGIGKRKQEVRWPIIQISWNRSRYVYDKYRSGEINRKLYEWLLENDYADASLIAKWKKPGYEFLCSPLCIDAGQTNFGSTCICRVPLAQRDKNKTMNACAQSGCYSCVSEEASRFKHPIWHDTPRPADLKAWALAGCPTKRGLAKRRAQAAKRSQDALVASGVLNYSDSDASEDAEEEEEPVAEDNPAETPEETPAPEEEASEPENDEHTLAADDDEQVDKTSKE